MLVMGGIVGSGIFINPCVVAGQVHTPLMILGVWILGGMIALGGAFIRRSYPFEMVAASGVFCAPLTQPSAQRRLPLNYWQTKYLLSTPYNSFMVSYRFGAVYGHRNTR
jgi:hypothetical protein